MCTEVSLLDPDRSAEAWYLESGHPIVRSKPPIVLCRIWCYFEPLVGINENLRDRFGLDDGPVPAGDDDPTEKCVCPTHDVEWQTGLYVVSVLL